MKKQKINQSYSDGDFFVQGAVDVEFQGGRWVATGVFIGNVLGMGSLKTIQSKLEDAGRFMRKAAELSANTKADYTISKSKQSVMYIPVN